MRHTFAQGKYGLSFDEASGEMRALRHGEPWPAKDASLVGDKLAFCMLARVDDLTHALLQCQALFQQALPKFNWGASALDANAIRLLNDVPLLVGVTLREEES